MALNSHQLHHRKEFSDIRQLIEWAGETHGEKIAYSYREKAGDKEIQKISFARLREDVRWLSSYLIEQGCRGKHCAVIGSLSYDWILVYYAVLVSGGVLVPLDRDWTATDLASTAKEANISFLFCDKDLAEKAHAVEQSTPLLCPPVLLRGAENEHSVQALTLLGRNCYQADATLYHNTPIDPNALALLVFTSGTTGAGKGVMLSQTAVLSNICAALPYIDYSEKTVGVLPPHHTYGSTVMFVGHTVIGSEVYLSSGLRHIQRELKEQKPGHMILVPLYLETFYRKILANAKEQGKERLLRRMIRISNLLRKVGIDLRKKLFASVRDAFGGELRMVISGGAPISREIVDFFDSIGISTLNGYGITECAPLIAVNRSLYRVANSVGHVIDVDTVKIDDPDENGEGEILVKGPNVMLGYYGKPEATKDAIDEEGFFHTGDYGRLRMDGVLFITGRKKNLIILSNGKNVYPEEIESALSSMPGVLETVVYEGVSKRGAEHNAIVAEIYPDADYLKKNGITDAYAFLKGHINVYNRSATPYKKIGVLKVRTEEFPKNTLRKILRFRLDTSIE